MNRQTVALIAILVSATAVGYAWGEVRYTVTDLGTLGGASSSVCGINSSGQIVGQADTSSGAKHAFLYSGGVMADLGTFGGANSCARGINDGGQVVGNAETGEVSPPPFSEPYSHAFVYNGGSLQDLGTLPGGSASGAVAINGNGQIAGVANTSNNLFSSHAFCYSGGVMQDLGSFGVLYSNASAINSTGQIVGSYGWFTYNGPGGVQAGGYHAFLYNDGTVQDLGTLPGAAFSYANAINNRGEIVVCHAYA